GAGRFGKRAGHLFFLEQVGKHRHMRRPLGCDPTIFSEVTPDRVDAAALTEHGSETPTPPPAAVRSSPPRTACWGAAPLRRSPRHRSRRSFAASQTALHRRAGAAELHGQAG